MKRAAFGRWISVIPAISAKNPSTTWDLSQKFPRGGWECRYYANSPGVCSPLTSSRLPGRHAGGYNRAIGSSRYIVKLYDCALAAFDFVQDGPGAAHACNLEIDPALRHLLPLNMAAEPDDGELRRFLNTRRIPKNRAYIEAILEPFDLAAHDTKTIIDLTKGVSINDSYMVVAEDDATPFEDCNLFDNDFNVALQIVAYTGVVSEGDFADGLPSELTASGSFPKATTTTGAVLVEGRAIRSITIKATQLEQALIEATRKPSRRAGTTSLALSATE